MSNYLFTIKILGIQIFSLEIKKNADILKVEKTKEVKEVKKQIPNPRENNSNYQGAIKPDLKALEKELNPVEEIPSIIVTCVSCEGTTYDDDINICSKCEKPICSGCGTYDSLTFKHYCTECWKNI